MSPPRHGAHVNLDQVSERLKPLLCRHGLPRHGHTAYRISAPINQENAAVYWNRFAAAEELLKLGADVNFQDSNKMTALHYVLKKGSDKKHARMLIKYGARGDIKNGAASQRQRS